MKTGRRFGAALALVAILSACGGGGGGGGGGPPPPTGSNPPPPPPPPPASAGCSLRERQNWAASQLNEWYLFPETLPTNPNPAAFSTVDDYIDHLTSVARSQGRDRYFTYLTSIAEENAYYSSGATAGFGFRLASAPGALLILESFEGAPALAAGIDRGARIEAIGTTATNMRTINELLSEGGAAAVTNALGPNTVGTTRVLRVSDGQGTRNVTLAKADYELLPVSPRYGVRIVEHGGRKLGYLNLRTFISTADSALRNAFAQFRSEGVTEIVIDLRYNGGGLVATAELMGDLLGRNRTTSDVFSFTTFRTSKSQFNETRFFQPQPQSVAPTRIAFIGTGGTASASELVINAFIPYLHADAALVGTNTYGKPVGQIGIDRAQCDDRLRIVAFATQNRLSQGNYFNGLAGVMEATCQAPDNVTIPLGNPVEDSMRRAIDFLDGQSCTPISASASARAARAAEAPRELLMSERPNAAQREVPGLF